MQIKIEPAVYRTRAGKPGAYARTSPIFKWNPDGVFKTAINGTASRLTSIILTNFWFRNTIFYHIAFQSIFLYSSIWDNPFTAAAASVCPWSFKFRKSVMSSFSIICPSSSTSGGKKSETSAPVIFAIIYNCAMDGSRSPFSHDASVLWAAFTIDANTFCVNRIRFLYSLILMPINIRTDLLILSISFSEIWLCLSYMSFFLCLFVWFIYSLS